LTILGLIQAGGRSTRFGSDKALAEIEGRPMIARVATVLRAGCARVAVNAPLEGGVADWARAAGLEVVPDAPDSPDGPLAGVVAGLAWTRARGGTLLATAPCDTPWLPADLAPVLAARLTDGARAVAARSVDGPQPLCALWRPSGHDTLRALLEGGRHPAVRTALAALDAVYADFPDPAAFANVNAAGDLGRV